MDYRVRLMDDRKMPDEHVWLICDEEQDGTTLYLRRSVRMLPDDEFCMVLEDAWTGFCEMRARQIERDEGSVYSSAATAWP